eukprot:3011961-Karenia_brevis.AAC.1
MEVLPPPMLDINVPMQQQHGVSSTMFYRKIAQQQHGDAATIHVATAKTDWTNKMYLGKQTWRLFHHPCCE